MNEVSGVRLTDRVHCYELSAGYPACAYPQYHYIIAYGKGGPESVRRTVNAMDGAYGDYCEFYSHLIRQAILILSISATDWLRRSLTRATP
jgi:hypothetical protein